MEDFVIEMLHITKEFPGIKANDDVTLQLRRGEIHALLGENGAGKSTLMSVLFGLYQPEQGIIKKDGKEVQIRNPNDATALHIGMVHQHFMLTPVMTITENVIVGCEPVHGPFLDRKKATESVQALIDKFHFHLNASARVQALSVGEQQRVEILKALYRGANVLILDEPTAVLTPQEVGELFSVLRELKAAGKSIIIITHKLRETAEIADRVSVLRAGVMVDQGLSAAGCSASDLALMMVGRKVDLSYTRRSKSVGETAYQVQNLNLTVKGVPILRDVALEVHKGEILGIAGIEGNGQSELIEVLTGLRKPDSMDLVKDGLPLSGKTAAFLSAGVGHIPEDRLVRGMIGPMTIEDNIILGYHRKKEFSKHGIRRKNEIRAFSEKQLTDYQIKAPNVQEKCGSLSGGNQQKVVVARVFSEDPDVLIAAQPTRGVDVGAQELIHSRLLDLRDAGKAVLLISADLDEVRRLSDRIAVIYEGKIVAQGSYDTWNEMELGLLMAGEKAEKEARP